MEGSPQAAVTPEGVRDGDPAVLAALVARRGPAVLAFCEAVCDPARSPRAAAEAFARFRALVTTIGDLGGLDPELFLLGATRHAAASMARPPSDDRGVLRVLGRGTSAETYAAVPALLAARADSMLGAEDLERLLRLLERSPGCREVEAGFRRAERGYRSPPDRPVPGTTLELIIGAMQAAAPVAEAFASALPRADATATPVPARDTPVESSDAVTAVHPVVEPVVPPPPPETAPGPAAPDPFFPPPPDPYEPPHDGADVPPAEDLAAGLALPVAALPDDPGVMVAPRGRRLRLHRPALPVGGGLHLPRRRRPDAVPAVDHGPVYRLLLPALAVVIAVLVMLAIAGVFGGGAPAPATALTTGGTASPLAGALAAIRPSPY